MYFIGKYEGGNTDTGVSLATSRVVKRVSLVNNKVVERVTHHEGGGKTGAGVSLVTKEMKLMRFSTKNLVKLT